ncbi:hypothetical protein [Streptomyces sp. NPDC055036]
MNRDKRPYPQRIDNIGVPYVVGSTTIDPSHPPTIADYIAAMHPGVGTVLADWLDRMADANEAVNDWTRGLVATLNLDARAVARQINGTQCLSPAGSAPASPAAPHRRSRARRDAPLRTTPEAPTPGANRGAARLAAMQLPTSGRSTNARCTTRSWNTPVAPAGRSPATTATTRPNQGATCLTPERHPSALFPNSHQTP